MSASRTRTLGLQATDLQNVVDRTHREGGTFQWVREVLMNSLEAGADTIHFGLEWQAVERKGVYRRLIADDGCGMSPEHLVRFFRSFGGGGKPIGGVHQNYGVGSKTSLLPWNHHGMVVVSWVDGEGSMIWLHKDPESGEYGLRTFEVTDPDTGMASWEAVVEPFDDEEAGCDWSKVGRDVAKEHGTVIVLMGNDPQTHTVLGDPSRKEGELKGISSYLNRRIWELDETKSVTVEELMRSDPKSWPSSRVEAKARGTGKSADSLGTNKRTIRGACRFIEYSESTDAGLKASDIVELEDGTQIDWFLWEGDRPRVDSYAARSGYVAVLYKNELYDVTDHAATFRSFGVAEASVRQRVWIVVRPPEFCEDTGRTGIYPRTDRNGLLIQGGDRAGDSLPIHDWAAQFVERMPEALTEANRSARTGDEGSVTDRAWRERLAGQFGKLWRIPRFRAASKGDSSVTPEVPGGQPRKAPKKRRPASRSGGGEGGTTGESSSGSRPGPRPAVRSRLAGAIPHFRHVPADSMDDSGHLAAWQPNDPEHPEGVVLINIEHPVLEAEVERWTSMYAPSQAEQVASEVRQAYGELAVAKVAHSEQLAAILPREVIETELRSGAAMTMALLGLMGADAMLSNRLKFRVGRRRTG